MNRRYFVTTAGIVLAAMVTLFGLYLSQSPAGDQGTSNDKSASVTISERQLQKLVDRISSLETRVKSLEQAKGVHLIEVLPSGTVPQTFLVQPPQEQWPNDGFGPMKVIPAG
jgi:hypothetical protein